MKIVIVSKGNENINIEEILFEKDNELFVLNNLVLYESKIKNDKVIQTYTFADIDGYAAEQRCHLLENTNPITVKATYIGTDEFKITDIHIYDKREKSEVYIINKGEIKNMIKDYTKFQFNKK
jgi:hypothetical protein